MAYQENIPQPGTQQDDSQADLLGNFQAIKQLIDVNHGTFGSVTEGKHKWVTFPVQAVAPAFAANEEGLYNKQLAGVSELYVHKQSFAGVKEIPFTASTLSTSTPASGVGGWMWLPTGYFQVFGATSGNGLTTITLATPPTNQISNVQLTPVTGSTSYSNLQVVLVDILSASQFRVFVSVAGVAAVGSFHYLVTGY